MWNLRRICYKYLEYFSYYSLMFNSFFRRFFFAHFVRNVSFISAYITVYSKIHIFGLVALHLNTCIELESILEINVKTRRLAACTQAVVILRRTSYIAVELNVLHFNTPVIWEHSTNVENTRLRVVFSTFPSCSQMPVVFYHSVIHGLGFFIC